jgi:NADPH2:quinone reductase
MVDVPEPTGDGTSLLVDVKAVGVNFPDLLLTKGQYQDKPELPAVPGCEVAGVVLEAPDGSPWSPGDRVAAWIRDGGFAERALVTPRTAARIPDGADFETAAAMVVNYHTVHFALHRRGRVAEGETVLVLGAGGGIGSAGVQVAKGLGARVVAGVASDEQVATAQAAGADEVLVLDEGFSAAVRATNGGRGVDAVLDPLGDWLTGEALRALAPEGRLLIVGFAAGGIPELKANRLLLRNVSAVGVAWGAFLDVDPGVMATAADALADMFERGVVRPPIGRRFTLEEVPEALALLERGEIAGKAVASVG